MRWLALMLVAHVACILDNPDFDDATSGAEGTTTNLSVTSTPTSSTTSSTTSTSTSTSTSTPEGSESESSGAITGSSTGCEDGDEDGACDMVDNCPSLANPDQLDGDSDGRGDLCDVCNTPGFDDDYADYDDDGLPCADDPCPHDGPVPPSYPAVVGPSQEITISGVALNDGGSFITVAPGEAFTLKYSWAVNFCACPGCVTQGMVGISEHPPAQCFYNAGSQNNCKDLSGAEEQVFTAPAAPGLYRLRSRRTWDYECKPQAPLESVESEFAAICVK